MNLEATLNWDKTLISFVRFQCPTLIESVIKVVKKNTFSENDKSATTNLLQVEQCNCLKCILGSDRYCIQITIVIQLANVPFFFSRLYFFLLV